MVKLNGKPDSLESEAIPRWKKLLPPYNTSMLKDLRTGEEYNPAFLRAIHNDLNPAKVEEFQLVDNSSVKLYVPFLRIMEERL